MDFNFKLNNKKYLLRYISSIFILFFYFTFFLFGALPYFNKNFNWSNYVFIFINVFLICLINFEILKLISLNKKKFIIFQIISYLIFIFLYIFPFPNEIYIFLPPNKSYIWSQWWIIFLFNCFFLFFLFIYAVFDKNINFKNIILYYFLMQFILLSFKAIKIMMLHKMGNDIYYGWTSMLFLFVVVVLTDSFAFISGVLFGKNKLAIKISPNKTWEGAIIGIVVSSIISYGILLILYFILSFDDKSKYLPFYNVFYIENKIIFLIVLFLFTFLTSIISQLGDLLFSFIKRTFNIKDFSNLIPGHGGILDRLDSLILVSFIVYYFTVLMI